MENLKKTILEILIKHSEKVYSAGSCGELGDSFNAVVSEDFNYITNDIIEIIDACIDPENQPNQYGIDMFKKERDRIWFQLLQVLPIDDKGDLIQGDEVYSIVFNNKQDKSFYEGIFKKSFEASVEIVMRYLSENHHPHTMIQIESNSAQLFEGVKSHLTDKYLKD
ncbi:hypothetical protein HZP25_18705 [Elizabethkingia anophelis]|nr:hypothetical protein [Elizabethkingia anophelis]